MSDDLPLFDIDRYLPADRDTLDTYRLPLPDDVTGDLTVYLDFPNGDRVTVHPDRVAIKSDHVAVELPAEYITANIRIQNDR